MARVMASTAPANARSGTLRAGLLGERWMREPSNGGPQGRMRGRRSRMKIISLRARLTVLLALAVLVALGAAAKIVDWRADTEMQQRFDASLLARAQSLAALTQIEDGKFAVDAENAATATFPGGADTAWYELRCGGAVIARTAEVPPPLAAGAQPVFADADCLAGAPCAWSRCVSCRHSKACTRPRRGRRSAPCVTDWTVDRSMKSCTRWISSCWAACSELVRWCCWQPRGWSGADCGPSRSWARQWRISVRKNRTDACLRAIPANSRRSSRASTRYSHGWTTGLRASGNSPRDWRTNSGRGWRNCGRWWTSKRDTRAGTTFGRSWARSAASALNSRRPSPRCCN